MVGARGWTCRVSVNTGVDNNIKELYMAVDGKLDSHILPDEVPSIPLGSWSVPYWE